MELKDIEVISKIAYNFFLIVSLIVGAGWAYYTFYAKKEPAALKVEINDITHHFNKKDGQYYLNINLFIQNLGDRDLNLLYDESELIISKINLEDDYLEVVNSKKGIWTHTNYNNGRIRSKVSYNLPYYMKVRGSATYFIEFILKVGMTDYHKTKDKDKISWMDRKFYTIQLPENHFKS